MQFLKADTAATVLIGPFLDMTNGVTPETGITLGAADSAEIMKHDGTVFADIAALTFTHKAHGMYTLAITSGFLDTEGRLTVFISDESVCLPVWAEFMVVNANVYDSLFAAATTDYLQTHTVEMTAGVIVAATLGADCITEAKIANDALANEHFAAGALTATEITGAAGCAVSSIGANVITATAINADAITSAKIADDAIAAEHLATGAFTADAFAADALVAATFATGAFTADAFAANALVAATFGADCITAAKVADDVHNQISDTVWNEAQADHVGVGTMGILGSEIADILADTNELQVDNIPGLIATAQADLDIITGAAGVVIADGLLTAAKFGADCITAAKVASDVHTESAAAVWAATEAITGDTHTYAKLLTTIFMFLFHEMNITDATGAMQVRNSGDTGNVITATITDDDTTTDRTKAVIA